MTKGITMKKNWALFVILIVLLLACTGCGASQTANQPAPTYTPYPTYTPLATLEPKAIMVTSTASPDFTQIYQFAGTGKETTDLFKLDEGTVKITWEYSGKSNFVLQLNRLDTGDSEMLANAIGNVKGQKILKVEASDEYLFDALIASGNWTVTVFYRP
jgi:hypothetical protein